MKSKVIALILLSIAAITSHGETNGLLPVASLLSGHIRCLARSGASIGFDYGDDDTLTDYRFFEMTSKGDSGYDDFRAHNVELRFGHFTDGFETIDSIRRFSLKTVSSGKEAAMSACLKPVGNTLKLMIGGEEIEEEFILADALVRTARARHRKNGKAKIVFENDLVLNLGREFAPEPYSSQKIDSIATLESDGGIEGVWRHYEQSSDPLRVSDSRRYSLGCIATTEGYELFIIDCRNRGEEAEQDSPGTVKAVLTPTSMDGIFEMTWFDIHGESIGSDNTAAFEGDLLTLSFPRWEAAVRYIRQR